MSSARGPSTPGAEPGLIEVECRYALHLPEAGLWLDPRRAKPLAFVSHAHADHVARHARILASPVTAALLRSRYNIPADRIASHAFGEPFAIGGFEAMLLPAGHIPGSAMLHLTRAKDGTTLLYTGDFKLRAGRTTETAAPRPADILIMETTFGLPRYRFPATAIVEERIVDFVNNTLASGDTPVLLGYSLGKAQEAYAILSAHGIPALLYPTAAEMTRTCIAEGAPGLPEPSLFEGEVPAGHAVIAPPHARKTKLLASLAKQRTAMLSGWALQPAARFRYQVDAMIPLSDHADHPELLECIRLVRPRRILTVHGFAKEFATELRSLGLDAWSASGGDQLELPIR
jgi:DNA ligase-1